jgi:hypothetical protein
MLFPCKKRMRPSYHKELRKNGDAHEKDIQKQTPPKMDT